MGENDVGGERLSASALMERFYDELRAIARVHMAGERRDHTLQPTALVHEVFLRLKGSDVRWNDERHFRSIAAVCMVRLLVDHAKRRNATKRGGQRRRDFAEIERMADLDIERDGETIELLAEALDRLGKAHPDALEVAHLRFVHELSVAQIAALIGVSEATVDRRWTLARTWLAREMSRSTVSGGDR